MFRLGFAVAALALAACAPEIPDSNPDRGVGFGDYGDYRTYQNTAPPSAQIETTVIADTTRGTETPASPNTPDVVVTGNNTTFAPPATTKSVADVKPVPVPTRTGNDGPSIVEYALTTRHGIGTKMYSRGVFSGDARAQRNCAAYGSAELAQEAFLKTGGPEKDKLKLDPDGDGFACAWDPGPFRRMAG